MIHVFVLMLYLGTGDDRRLVSDNMHFYDLSRCNWFASEIVKRYGNYRYREYMDAKDRATAYCLPKYIPEGSLEVY
jgi:hypothetical protein